MSVFEAARFLAEEIKSSEDYQNFMSAKENILADQHNYNLIREFQHKQLEIQHAMLFQLEIREEQQQALERAYSLISLSQDARDYLEAEFRISRLVSEVQKIIGDAIQDVLPVGFEEQEQSHPVA